MVGITIKDLLLIYTSSIAPDGTSVNASFTIPFAQKTYVSVNSATSKLTIDGVSSISFDAQFSSNNTGAIIEEKSSVSLIIGFLDLNGSSYSLTTSTSGDVYSSDFKFTIPASLATELVNLLP